MANSFFFTVFSWVRMLNSEAWKWKIVAVKSVKIYPWKCSLTFFWSFANLFSYFETFFSVGLMLRAQCICFWPKYFGVDYWQKKSIIQHEKISPQTHQLQMCTIIQGDLWKCKMQLYLQFSTKVIYSDIQLIYLKMK